jgi:alanine racemase
MNLTIVDVTALPSVAVGDEAVVLGKGITAEDHARLAATIPYEILCGIKAPRLLL